MRRRHSPRDSSNNGLMAEGLQNTRDDFFFYRESEGLTLFLKIYYGILVFNLTLYLKTSDFVLNLQIDCVY
jgi:hypothetical protein